MYETSFHECIYESVNESVRTLFHTMNLNRHAFQKIQTVLKVY